MCDRSIARKYLEYLSQVIYCGGYSGGEPPLPIPNREVKPAIADGTAPPGGRVGSCRSSRTRLTMSAGSFCFPPSSLSLPLFLPSSLPPSFSLRPSLLSSPSIFIFSLFALRSAFLPSSLPPSLLRPSTFLLFISPSLLLVLSPSFSLSELAGELSRWGKWGSSVATAVPAEGSPPAWRLWYPPESVDSLGRPSPPLVRAASRHSSGYPSPIR